jgi:hypothetical protein
MKCSCTVYISIPNKATFKEVFGLCSKLAMCTNAEHYIAVVTVIKVILLLPTTYTLTRL